MKITWLGHSAFLVEGNDRILIDPFIGENPVSPVSPDDLSCDIICVTHGHGDHLGDAISIAKRNDAKILAIFELANYFESQGCEAVGPNIGGTACIGGSKIFMTRADHSAGADVEGLTGAAGVATGLVIESGKTVYHAGDTALFGDMRLIGKLFALDAAMLPIGGFYTMDPVQAAMAVEMLRPKVAIPMHYNTWPPIETDPERFKSEVSKLVETEVRILKPGESTIL